MSATDNLSALQFVQRVKATGGATMDLNSGKLISPGKRAYIVGGEKDTSGVRIPTQYVPADEFGPHHVEAAVTALRQQTGGRARVNLGAWSDGGNVELDASARTRRPGEAIRKGRARGEKAIWNNKNMSEIDTGGRG